MGWGLEWSDIYIFKQQLVGTKSKKDIKLYVANFEATCRSQKNTLAKPVTSYSLIDHHTKYASCHHTTASEILVKDESLATLTPTEFVGAGNLLPCIDKILMPAPSRTSTLHSCRLLHLCQHHPAYHQIHLCFSLHLHIYPLDTCAIASTQGLRLHPQLFSLLCLPLFIVCTIKSVLPCSRSCMHIWICSYSAASNPCLPCDSPNIGVCGHKAMWDVFLL